MTKTIKLELETAKSMYKTASPEFKILLEENFGKKVLANKVSERVSDFDDILSELDKTMEDVIPWKGKSLTKNQISLNAASQIQAITEVYNQGEELDWTNTSQPKYYIWWEKKAHGGWVLCGVNGSHYRALLGSGMYFVRREDAQDAANKFKDIFVAYLPK